MKGFIVTSTVLISAFGATVLNAQEGIPPLEQCEGIYSIQKRMCAVEHVYRCETEDGVKLRYDEWEQADSTKSIEVSTLSGDIIAAWDDDQTLIITGAKEIRDPMSVEALLKATSETYDYVYVMQFPGMDDPVDAEVSGSFENSGKTVTLDGIEFQTAKNSFNFAVMGMQATGFENVLIDPMTLAVIGGEAEFDMGDGGMSSSGAPAKVILPGQPGFLRNAAEFDCN